MQCGQVRKPHWELKHAGADVKRGGGDAGLGNSIDGEGDKGRLPGVEGRGGSVKRVKGVGDKDVVRFR